MITSKEYIEARNEEMARFMLAHYGLKAQKMKMIEELSELIQALAKDDINAIKEEVAEVADVEVMLMQIKSGMHIETAEIMNYKLNRQKARIENAKRK